MSECTLTAFYGGTFDPIHHGHLWPVITLARRIHLKQVILLLNNIPPHRSSPLASSNQRLAMITLAISELPKNLFILDNREHQRHMPSYTVDTFEELRRQYGANTSLAFIIGQDSLFTLPSWYRGLELLDLCHLLVCARPGYNTMITTKYVNYWLAGRLTIDLQALYSQPAGLVYYDATTTQLAISASNIRNCYRQNFNCDGVLSPLVQHYINEQGLYR